MVTGASKGDASAAPPPEMTAWLVSTPEAFGAAVTSNCSGAYAVVPASTGEKLPLLAHVRMRVPMPVQSKANASTDATTRPSGNVSSIVTVPVVVAVPMFS